MRYPYAAFTTQDTAVKYYLLTFIPILGALFLLYFFVSDSAPEENRYGKSPKYAQETF